ncbi:HAD family phosphatase [Ligilactobacillus sp. Marseille-Q7487]|jgi:HAD superfamily hydrolase (TIGR01509 family)|uniref:HAD family hydrolase n=1 Tax=Ligilactobacillus sp. Marseille-Q7487 TaxID=3022128 RepID=UPI0015B74CB5|nr:HAD family phosphatase [Ligilactobacillus sp. Marseille-Q7487]
MDVELVIFDMDGVIFDSEKVYFKSNSIAAEQLGMDYSFEYYRQFIGGGNEAMFEQMVKDYGDRDLISKFFEISFANIYPVVDQGELKLKPGFLELTKYLDEQKIAYTLASSNDKDKIEYFLEKTGLEHNFQHIICADDVHEAKPDPEVFNVAWAKSGAPDKQKTIIIEDSVNGIKAANNAEIPVIMVPDYLQPGEYERQHTLAILDDLHQVKDFIVK